ncbi:MAG: hypothetical protein QM214_03350 [Bacillota bacterium]|jgi:hypothetical protein|nr:hypothetical protein [Bacillota bacterium]
MSIEDKDMHMREGDKRRMLMSLKDEAQPTKKLYRKKSKIKPV